MRPANSSDPYQVNKKSRKKLDKSTTTAKSPTHASRGTLGISFVDSHRFQGCFLRLVLMDMDSVDASELGVLRVYKKDKVRLQDAEHMNRLPLRCNAIDR